VAERGDVGNTLAVDELRDDCDGDAILPAALATGVPHGLDDVLRSGLAHDLGARSSVRRLVHRLAARRRASARVPARWARRRSSFSVAALDEPDDRVVEEAADLVYHLYVLLAARGLDIAQVDEALRLVVSPADALLFEVMTRPANLVNPIKAKFARPQSG
jgi:hypothetical protein